jgi:hypothetical protein
MCALASPQASREIVSSDQHSYEGWCIGAIALVLIGEHVVRWGHKPAIRGSPSALVKDGP